MVKMFLSLITAFSLVSCLDAGEPRVLGEWLCGSKVKTFQYRKVSPGMKAERFKVAVQRRNDGVDLVRSDSDEPDGYQTLPGKIIEERSWFTLLWTNMAVGEKQITPKAPKGRDIVVEVLSVDKKLMLMGKGYMDCVTLLVQVPGVQLEKRIYSWGVGLVRSESYMTMEDLRDHKPSQIEELIAFR